MSEIGQDIIEITRSIAANLYFEWLINIDLLQRFDRPETIPSVFYQLNYPSEHHEVIENIFLFLEKFNVIKEAGGTFVLSKSINELKNEFSSFNLSDYKTHAGFNFIKYGLKLIEERLEGGTGYWDLDNQEFLFERGVTQEVFQFYAENLNNIFREYTFDSISQLKIVIFGTYVDIFINQLIKSNINVDNISIILPTEELKERAITFCELSDKNSFYSRRIFTTKEISEGEYNMIFVANGLGFYNSLNNQIQYFHKLLTTQGMLISFTPTYPKFQFGLEPLFTLHEEFKNLPPPTEFEKIIKANGFSDLTRIGYKEFLIYTQKEN